MKQFHLNITVPNADDNNTNNTFAAVAHAHHVFGEQLHDLQPRIEAMPVDGEIVILYHDNAITVSLTRSE